MKKRIGLSTGWILILAILLAACGTGETSGNTSGDEAIDEMTAQVEQLENGTYRYIVLNKTESAETFNFTSGQRFDFSLSNEAGEEVFLLSSVSAYIQALGTETVEPGQELSYDFEVPPLELEPGTYTLEAWLTPEEGPAFNANSEYIVE